MNNYEYTSLFSDNFDNVFVPYLSVDKLDEIRQKLKDKQEWINDFKVLVRKAFEYDYYRENGDFPAINENSENEYIRKRIRNVRSNHSGVIREKERKLQEIDVSKTETINTVIKPLLKDDNGYSYLCRILELKNHSEMTAQYSSLLEYSLSDSWLKPREYFERYLIPKKDQEMHTDHLSKTKFLVELTRALCSCAERNTGKWLTSARPKFCLHDLTALFDHGIENYSDREILEIFSQHLVQAEMDKDYILKTLNGIINDIRSKDNPSKQKIIVAEQIEKILSDNSIVSSSETSVEFGLESFAEIEKRIYALRDDYENSIKPFITAIENFKKNSIVMQKDYVVYTLKNIIKPKSAKAQKCLEEIICISEMDFDEAKSKGAKLYHDFIDQEKQCLKCKTEKSNKVDNALKKELTELEKFNKNCTYAEESVDSSKNTNNKSNSKNGNEHYDEINFRIVYYYAKAYSFLYPHDELMHRVFVKLDGINDSAKLNEPYKHLIYLLAADRTDECLSSVKTINALREFIYDCCFALREKRDREAVQYYRLQLDRFIPAEKRNSDIISQWYKTLNENRNFNYSELEVFRGDIGKFKQSCNDESLSKGLRSILKSINEYERISETDRITEQLFTFAFEQPAVNYRSVEELVYFRVLENHGSIKDAKEPIMRLWKKKSSKEKISDNAENERFTVDYQDMYYSEFAYYDDIDKMIDDLEKNGFAVVKLSAADIRKTANALFNYLINSVVVLLLNSSKNESVRMMLDSYKCRMKDDSKTYNLLMNSLNETGYVKVYNIISSKQQAVSYSLLEENALKDLCNDKTDIDGILDEIKKGLFNILHPSFVKSIDTYTAMNVNDLSFKAPLVSRASLIKAYTAMSILSGTDDLTAFKNTINRILELCGFAQMDKKNALDCYMIAVYYYQLNLGDTVLISKGYKGCKEKLDQLKGKLMITFPDDLKSQLDKGTMFLSEIDYENDKVSFSDSVHSNIWNKYIKKVSLRDADYIYIPYYGFVLNDEGGERYLLVLVYPVNISNEDNSENRKEPEACWGILFDCIRNEQGIEKVFNLENLCISPQNAHIKDRKYIVYIPHKEFFRIVNAVSPFKKIVAADSYPILTFHSFEIKNMQNKDNILCLFAVGHTDDGTRQILGGWTFVKEKFNKNCWETVFSDLKEKGITDVGLVCTDLPNNFEQALEKEYPKAKAQCYSYMIQLISENNLKRFCTKTPKTRINYLNDEDKEKKPHKILLKELIKIQRNLICADKEKDAEKLCDKLLLKNKDPYYDQIWHGEAFNKEKVLSFYELNKTTRDYLLKEYKNDSDRSIVLKKVKLKIKSQIEAGVMDKGDDISIETAEKMLGEILLKYSKEIRPH